MKVCHKNHWKNPAVWANITSLNHECPMKRILFLAACGLALAFAPIAFSQSYSIDWFTIDGGGGTSTGGVYSVSGTIGQPDAGTMSGGPYTLQGGFWGVAVAIQTEGAPLLTVTKSGGSVVVSWPSPSTGFVLQENMALGTTNWLNVATLPSDNGTSKSVTVSPPIGNKFYRLKK